jgi:hypothetical protein
MKVLDINDVVFSCHVAVFSKFLDISYWGMSDIAQFEAEVNFKA